MEFFLAGILAALIAIAIELIDIRKALLRSMPADVRLPEPESQEPKPSYLAPVDRSIKRFERRSR